MSPFPELSSESVRMRDRGSVERILRSIKKDGAGKLQVISDFDMTLTRFAYNGKRCPTCHNILESSLLINDHCKVELQGLFKTYYPIEIDSKLSLEEKFPHMVEWWTKAHNLLVEQKIKKTDISAAVEGSEVRLRDEHEEFFDLLNKSEIPLLIFSAGIGDVLEEVIHQAGVFHHNVKVFSNYMEFDKSGVLRDFRAPLIHTYNKREGAVLNAEHFKEFCSRTNVLLLGDSLGDLEMADGVKDMQNIFKIGFLNDKVEECRESYINAYDIVLEKDETMNVPNDILRYITGV